MRNKLKRPCDKCRRDACLDRECNRYRRWFKAEWETTTKRIKQAAWDMQDRIGKQQHPDKFIYMAPDEMKNPCEKCLCKGWCARPCSLRYAWWQHQMKKLREKLMR